MIYQARTRIAALLLLVLAASQSALAQQKKPNVIILATGGTQAAYTAGELKLAQVASAAGEQNLFRARGSMLFFLLGIVLVVLIGIFPNLRPAYAVVSEGVVTDTDQVSMGMAIMIVMIAIAGLIMVVFKASPEAALKGTIMRSGITAIICILGISWLGSSFFEGNRTFIVGGISSVLEVYPWTFAIGMFVLSTMLAGSGDDHCDDHHRVVVE